MSDDSHKSCVNKSSVQGSLRIEEGENLREEIKNTKKEISELKDMFSKYLIINEKPKSRDVEGHSRRRDKFSNTPSHSEGIHSTHHSTNYYKKPLRQHRSRSHHNYNK